MDLVSDAVEAVRFLQNHPQVDPTRIAVMGHSEGAIIMPLICQEVEKGVETPSKDELPLVAPVKGAIFLAGFGCNLFDAMKMQRETALQEVQEQTGLKGWSMRKSLTRERMEKQYSDLMTKIEAPGNEDYVSMYLGLAKIPAKWFREHKAYDASSATKKITCHCLAITGQADVQVPHDWCDPITAKKLVPHAASIESHQPLRLTHALRSSDGPSRILSVKEDYTRLGKLPLDPELLSLIDNWCARVLCS